MKCSRCIYWLGVKTVEKCIQNSAEFFVVGAKEKVPVSRTIILVTWRKPPEGRAKLNIDGSALGNLGVASGGGLICDHNGDWIARFSRALGSTNSIIAKLLALRDGLTLAKELCLNSLIVEMDALSVVQLMSNNTINMLMEPLLSNCRNLLQAISNKRIEHVYREANQCADALAKMGTNRNFTFVVFVEPPPMVGTLLAFDKANMFCNRLINSNT